MHSKKVQKNCCLFNARLDAFNFFARWIKHVDIEQADHIRSACSLFYFSAPGYQFY
ncbi:hypothetical protein LR68_03926 [Anoxybacillus sp. BCO1]|nr:hypothetical protein LR68_03926 [Anoxybacillus sp. BCO1]